MNPDGQHEEKNSISRRRFVGTSSAALAGALTSGIAAAAPGTPAASNVTGATATDKTVLKNDLNGLEVHVSERTGGLTGLRFGGVGTLLRQDEALASLLTMRYPVEQFVPLMLESGLSKARIVRSNDGLSIHWNQLNGNRSGIELPAGRVSATVDIRPAPDGRSVILRARIENHSQGNIVEVLFPDLSGLRPTDEPDRMELRMALKTFNPLAGNVIDEPGGPAGGAFYAPDLWQEYDSGGGYDSYSLRWMDYGSLKGGFSVFERAWLTVPRANLMTHRNEADASELRVVWQHDIKVQPGEVWESPEYWLTPHVGGWANGIEPFRNYIRTVNPPRAVPVPERVRRGLGFQTIWMIPTAECDPKYAAFRFSDLGRVARDAKAHGIDELQIWGWCHYATFPITVREELGTEDELLAGIREAKEAGVNIALWVGLKEMDNKFAARYGLTPDSSDAWIFHPEMIPAMLPFESASGMVEVPSGNAVWQGDVYKALTDWMSRGVTSFGFDVFGERFEDAYDNNAERSLVDLTRRIREKVDPAAHGSYAGEVLRSFEWTTQVLDYTWCWNGYLDAGPYTAALGYPRINTNIGSSVRVTKMAFADNLYINAMPKWPNQPNGTKLLSQEAGLSAALKEVAPLRARFVEYFTEGDYLGDSFLSRPVARFVRRQLGFEYPPVMVRAYRVNGRMLIIILNNEDAPRNVTLECNLPLWLRGVNACRITGYDRRGVQTQSRLWRTGTNWVGTTPKLRPLELAFFEITPD